MVEREHGRAGARQGGSIAGREDGRAGGRQGGRMAEREDGRVGAQQGSRSMAEPVTRSTLRKQRAMNARSLPPFPSVLDPKPQDNQNLCPELLKIIRSLSSLPSFRKEITF